MRFLPENLSRKTGQLALSASLLGLVAVTGCTNPQAGSFNLLDTKSWIDPSELAGRVNKKTMIVPILNQVDASIEEPNRDFVTAQPPTQDDLVVKASDYVISKNDMLQIEMSDLNGPGTITTKTSRVSESGSISMPFVGQLKAEGKTEYEMEQAIIQAYKDAKIIERAQVTVAVVERRGAVISVLGAVNGPGQYALVDPDFRVLDAITLARETSSPLVTDLYIIRRTDSRSGKTDGGAAPVDGAQTKPKPAGGGVEDIKPQGMVPTTPRFGAIQPTAPAAARMPIGPVTASSETPKYGTTVRRVDGAAPLLLAEQFPELAQATGGSTDEKGRFIYVDGKKVYIGDAAAPATGAAPAPAPTPAPTPAPEPAPVPAPTPAPAPAPAPVVVEPASTVVPAQAEPGTGFKGFKDLSAPENVRIIHIPLERLRNGELQYNVVIKPKDMIIVQNLPMGEYYVGGHVGSPGAYTLSQRRITLKQAIIAARMLDQLAIPERTDIIRRLPGNKEVFVRINLAAIFDGSAPDIYLKPDDQVLVGTNALAPFIAAIRGAFRFTYGFGFLYDRNFAANENNSVGN